MPFCIAAFIRHRYFCSQYETLIKSMIKDVASLLLNSSFDIAPILISPSGSHCSQLRLLYFFSLVLWLCLDELNPLITD